MQRARLLRLVHQYRCLPVVQRSQILEQRPVRFSGHHQPVYISSAMTDFRNEVSENAETNAAVNFSLGGKLFQGWEDMWQKGIEPGDYFDKLGPHPALVDLLSSGLLENGGSALVPGCGRGYEVHAIAASGLYEESIGLDLAETGIAAAKVAAQGRRGAETMKFVCADFFAYKGVKPGGAALIVDYTFLCALPVELREKWAMKMCELLADDGVLVTLMFPLRRPVSEGGPPHGVTVAVYEELLGKVGLFAVEEAKILPDAMCHPGRGDGNSGIARWRKRA